MKYTRIILFSMALLAITAVVSSCGDKATSTELQGKEYTSTYVCPMHCEGSGGDEAGKCPVCGMEYVKNEDHKADGHKHEEHQGHNH